MKRLVVALLTLVLASCATLPRESAIYSTPMPAQGAGEVAFNPKDPTVDANPEEIIQGFLEASAAGLSDDFSTARRYLTTEAAKTWNPSQSIRIFPDTQAYTTSRTQSGAIRLAADAFASVDSSGVYQQSSPNSRITSEFTLMRNNEGQWRIAALEDGVIMTDSIFRSLYSQAKVYFYTTDLTALVPVVYYFPNTRAVSATLDTLIAGPPPWLAGSVRSILPVGTRLGSQGVTSSDGVVTVNFTSDVLSLSEQELSRLYAQLNASLIGVGGTQQVQVTASGTELAQVTPADVTSYPYSNYPVTALRNDTLNDDTFSLVNPSNTAPEIATGVQVREPIALAPTYDADPTVIVLSDSAHLLSAVSGLGITQLYSSEQLLAQPSTDRYGYAWSAESNEQAGISQILLFSVTDPNLVAIFDASEIGGAAISNMRVSRDGVRLIVTADDGVGGTAMYVAPIVRESNGTPTEIGQLRRISTGLTAITDLAWIDDANLVVLGRADDDANLTLYEMPLSGPLRQITTSVSISSLTAGRGLESVVLETVNGRLLEYDGGAWRAIGTDLRIPEYPG